MTAQSIATEMDTIRSAAWAASVAKRMQESVDRIFGGVGPEHEDARLVEIADLAATGVIGQGIGRWDGLGQRRAMVAAAAAKRVMYPLVVARGAVASAREDTRS